MDGRRKGGCVSAEFPAFLTGSGRRRSPDRGVAAASTQLQQNANNYVKTRFYRRQTDVTHLTLSRKKSY
jgi:hypothetical protein